MKAYTYSPEEAGQSGWPDGVLRFEGATDVTDPAAADVFIVPGNLSMFPNPGDLQKLRYFKGNEVRHVFFDISELPTVYDQPCHFIRCNFKNYWHRQDPNSISWPWPVENYQECIEPLVLQGALGDKAARGFTHDVSFHGWLSRVVTTRVESTMSCLANDRLKCDFAMYEDFTGGIYHTGEGVRRRAEYRKSMQRSRLALCPESLPGDFPYRFFEAMSAGRVPVLIGSEFSLPFEDEIPYNDFCVFIRREEAGAAATYILKYLKEYSDDDLIAKGLLARRCWEKFLQRDHWPNLMRYAVQKSMHRLGLINEEAKI